jgi:hypothetical protein
VGLYPFIVFGYPLFGIALSALPTPSLCLAFFGYGNVNLVNAVQFQENAELFIVIASHIITVLL